MNIVNFKIQFAIYGIYILSFINITIFAMLLIYKIISRRKEKKDEMVKRYYKDIIDGFISNRIKDIPRLRKKRDLLIFKSVLLEFVSRSSKAEKAKLLDIAKETGLLKMEIDNLNNRSEARRGISAYFLGEIGAKEATEYLINNIDKSKKELSYVICRSLILVSGTEYIDMIVDILGGKDFTMKSKILDLISLIDEEDIYPKMKEYLDGKDIFKRVLALEALGNKEDKRAVPYIGEAIDSNEKELMISGLKAVIEIGYLDCEDIIPKIKMLKDHKEWEVRAFLAKGLGGCDDCNYDEVNILKEMISDLNWFVRFNSSESLLNLGEKGILALSETLYSSDGFARDRAWNVLQREIKLYDLFNRIETYGDSEYIINNINEYDNSIKGGVAVES